MPTLRTTFIEKYFHRLQEGSVKFCMPRGYVDLLTDVDKDIDVIMSPASYDLVMLIFSELVAELGGFVIETCTREKSLYMKALFHESSAGVDRFQGVYIHAVAYMTVKKTYFGRAIKYFGRRVWQDDIVTVKYIVEKVSIVIPAPVYELFLLLARYQQKQKFQYLDRCKELSRVEEVRVHLSQYELAGRLDNALHASTESERLEGMSLIVERLYLVLFKQRNSARLLNEVMLLVVRNIVSLFHINGRLVFFSGPDGSGKTTANHALALLLEKKLNIHVLNTKHLYPVSNRYSKKGQQIQARIRGIDGDRKRELERDRGHGLVWKLRRGLGLVFLLLQVYPGYIWARYKNWKGYTVIVDTSFFDVFVKGHRPVFPLIEFFSIRFIPCGSTWFLLKASPGAIVARKPELTTDEIEGYYKRLEEISRKSSCVPRIIRSDMGVDAAVLDMLDELSVSSCSCMPVNAWKRGR